MYTDASNTNKYYAGDVEYPHSKSQHRVAEDPLQLFLSLVSSDQCVECESENMLSGTISQMQYSREGGTDPRWLYTCGGVASRSPGFPSSHRRDAMDRTSSSQRILQFNSLCCVACKSETRNAAGKLKRVDPWRIRVVRTVSLLAFGHHMAAHTRCCMFRHPLEVKHACDILYLSVVSCIDTRIAVTPTRYSCSMGIDRSDQMKRICCL